MRIQRNNPNLPYLPFNYSYHDWQINGINTIIEKWNEFDEFNNILNPNALIVAVPGAGKTIKQLAISEYLKNTRIIDHTIILVPTANLVNQMIDDAKLLGIPLLDNTLDPPYNISRVLTYSMLCLEVQNNRQALHFLRSTRFLLIADEAHRLAEKTKKASAWFDSFIAVGEFASLRLLTTGTPFRTKHYERLPYCDYDPIYDKLGKFTGEYQLKADVEFTRKEAEKQKVITKIAFHGLDPDLSEERLKKAKGCDLYAVTDPDTGNILPSFKKALIEFDRHLTQSKKGFSPVMGLVNLKSINDCRQAQKYLDQLFPNKYRSFAVHSKDSKSYKTLNNVSKLRGDTGYDVIFSVKAVTVGISIKQLKVLLLWTNQRTDTTLAQMLGRVVRLISGLDYDKQLAHVLYLNEPKIVRALRRYADEAIPLTTEFVDPEDEDELENEEDDWEFLEPDEEDPPESKEALRFNISATSHSLLEGNDLSSVSDEEWRKAEEKSRKVGYRYTPEEILKAERIQREMNS